MFSGSILYTKNIPYSYGWWQHSHKDIVLEYTPPAIAVRGNIMRYTWVTIAILAIWIAASVLVVYSRITNPETFFLFTVLATVIIASVGFKSAY
ncbi:hypothetical protein KJ750_00365 [Patescibacteria group bacterium]|nr:hypothetical protein [Patescibacteria group bacterium]